MTVCSVRRRLASHGLRTTAAVQSDSGLIWGAGRLPQFAGAKLRAAGRLWLTTVLLVFLTLQTSWAAVNTYCQHETTAETQLVGHHKLPPQADVDQSGGADRGVIAATDSHCDTCHSGGSAVVSEAVQVLAGQVSAGNFWRHQPRVSSPAPSLPERPNWADLA